MDKWLHTIGNKLSFMKLQQLLHLILGMDSSVIQHLTGSWLIMHTGSRIDHVSKRASWISRTPNSHICLNVTLDPFPWQGVETEIKWPAPCRQYFEFSLIKAVVVSFKCHWICLQCAIDNMSILFNIMAWSCAGAKSETTSDRVKSVPRVKNHCVVVWQVCCY